MTRRKLPIVEQVARALCSHDGHPENIRFEGGAMWESYVPPARAALAAVKANLGPRIGHDEEGVLAMLEGGKGPLE